MKINSLSVLLTTNFRNERRTVGNRREAKRSATRRTCFGVYVSEE
jgi:hypothetical protein